MDAKKHTLKRVVGYLLTLLFLIGGCFFYIFVSGCSFLGIVLWGIGAICLLYNGLLWLQAGLPKTAKVVRRIVSVLLILVLIAAIITMIPVLRGPTDRKNSSDYVIVLGAGVRGTEPSEILQDRIDRAYLYLLDNPDAICIATGGKGSDEQISEARCIYNHLTAMGIDGDRIWLEEQATSTIENFRYSIACIEEKTGAVPKTVEVLSNEFHLFRASVMAKDCGLEASFIAAPTSNDWLRISYTVREVFALWKYLLIGG